MRHPRAVIVSFAAAAAMYLGSFTLVLEGQTGPTEAPAAFDNRPNGLITQAEFDAARATFEERDEITDGLGPVYNAQSCAECHQSPVTGAISQVGELRAGHQDASGNFVDAPGGSLIHDRAIDASIQERVAGAENVRTFRMSTNTLGSGFIEAINSNTIAAIANAQPFQSGGRIAGQLIQVPVTETPGAVRVGRFGWKNQHASLLSFSADAYLNEIGITSRLQATENTSLGRSILPFDRVADPEDTENDIDGFAAFMRATKAPPRDGAVAATSDAIAGSSLFDSAAAASATRVRSRPRRRAPASTEARSSSRPRWAARSSTRSATSCCTISTRGTASCRTAVRVRRTSCGRPRSGAAGRIRGTCTTDSR